MPEKEMTSIIVEFLVPRIIDDIRTDIYGGSIIKKWIEEALENKQLKIEYSNLGSENISIGKFLIAESKNA